MKIEYSPPAKEIAKRFGTPIPLTSEIGGRDNRCPSMTIYRHGDLYVIHRKFSIDLQEYTRKNMLASLGDAATEIELRENRIEIVKSNEFPRETSIQHTFERVVESFPLILRALHGSSTPTQWVLWANIQFHQGDFETDLDDLKNATATDLVENKSAWWFMADVSFARRRKNSEKFLRERISHDWGQTLSPIQMLCFD